MNVDCPAILRRPAIVASVGARASYGFLEFFTAQIRNPPRDAPTRAATEFFDWLEAKGVHAARENRERSRRDLLEQLQRARSAPTAKLRLAAERSGQ